MFTPYYILAVGFGAIATLVSLYGLKRAGDENFPGKLATPMMLVAALLGIATFTAVWRGGEKEVEHRELEEQQRSEGEKGAALPAGVTRDQSS